ncbi:hypothetical protein CEXT_792721 [Caerostris extrusa]|uniref:Uncharacterized protein n=1 Tax=Caerostris extrusa TaxID=172846 RepID=A0AAV4XVY4_CAEEX|nr:hypothetical protein CEXT_792721 [Caerostris extrusa]
MLLTPSQDQLARHKFRMTMAFPEIQNILDRGAHWSSKGKIEKNRKWINIGFRMSGYINIWAGVIAIYPSLGQLQSRSLIEFFSIDTVEEPKSRPLYY